MNITVLCTNHEHPVVPHIRRWQVDMEAKGHRVMLCADRSEAAGGDLLFLVSCSQIMREAERARYGAALVLHASDLPEGRGMSPHIWAIVRGASRVTVCLLEARDPVDSGDIWLKTEFTLQGHELLPEINERLFACELDLMTRAVATRGAIVPAPQADGSGPALRKRGPEDSRLDPEKTIAEQFDLLRVVDNARYPAFLDHRGHRYMITIEKAPR